MPSDRAVTCKRLREETGAPLKACLEALQAANYDYDQALIVIANMWGRASFKRAQHYFRSFVTPVKRGVVFGQLMGSDTLVRTREVDLALEQFVTDREALTEAMLRISFAAKENIVVSSWNCWEVENFGFYLHSRLDSRSSVGGGVVWKGPTTVSGEELHWAFGVTGQRGGLAEFKREDLLPNRANLTSIDGVSDNSDSLAEVESLVVLA